MPYEGKEALRIGYESIKEEIDDLITNEAITTEQKAFETWVQRNFIKKWVERQGWDIEYPPDFDSSRAIGEEGNDFQLDVGVIVKETAEEGNEDIYRAIICQCYYPSEAKVEGESDFYTKAQEVNPAILALKYSKGNEARIDFIQAIEEKGIVKIQKEDDNGLVTEEGSISEEKIIPMIVCMAERPSGINSAVSLQALEDDGLRIVEGTDLCQDRWLELNPSGHVVHNEKMIDFPYDVDIAHISNGVFIGHITMESLHEFFHEDRRESPWYKENKKGKNFSMLNHNLRHKIMKGNELSKNISSGMENTIKDQPEKFLSYNNGIVIVCSDIEKVEGENKKLLLKLPNIVNGGQTTNAVFEMWNKIHDESGSGPEGNVLVRIVKCEEEAEKKKIAKYANRQNPIEARDEHATDRDQIEYEALFKGTSGYILWDYKRGQKALLTQIERNNLRVTKTIIREINNTDAFQIYLAMNGAPAKAQTTGAKLWSQDKLIDFIFAQNRTEDLQKDTGVTYFLEGENAKEIYSERETREEFAKDIIVGLAMTKLRYSVHSKRQKRLKYVKEEKGADSDDFKKWQEYTMFHGHWQYALLMGLNLVINKHWKDAENKDEGQGIVIRNKIRNNLIGGEFWQDKTLTTRIFKNTTKWNEWTNIDINLEGRMFAEDRKFFTEMPLLGYWYSSFEEIFVKIDTIHRDTSNAFKKQNIYNLFKDEITNITDGAQVTFLRMFPLEMPIDDDEFIVSLLKLRSRWDEFRDGPGNAADQNYLKHELSKEDSKFIVTKNLIRDLDASTEDHEEMKSSLIEEMDNWYDYKKQTLDLQ